jgi:hypothetical protein
MLAGWLCEPVPAGEKKAAEENSKKTQSASFEQPRFLTVR